VLEDGPGRIAPLDSPELAVQHVSDGTRRGAFRAGHGQLRNRRRGDGRGARDRRSAVYRHPVAVMRLLSFGAPSEASGPEEGPRSMGLLSG